MDKNTVALTLSPEQLDAFTDALSFYEKLCRGDLGELLSLMQKKGGGQLHRLQRADLPCAF